MKPPRGQHHGAYMPVLRDDDPDFMDSFVARSVVELQLHSHTQTCTKGGYMGTDDDCRMWMPRPYVPQTCLLPGTEAVVVQRTGKYIVPYNRMLQLAYPCNMDITLLMDQGRYMRQHELWTAASTAGLTEAAEPVPLPIYRAAHDAEHYIIKYIFKDSDRKNSNNGLLNALLVRTRCSMGWSRACNETWRCVTV